MINFVTCSSYISCAYVIMYHHVQEKYIKELYSLLLIGILLQVYQKFIHHYTAFSTQIETQKKGDLSTAMALCFKLTFVTAITLLVSSKVDITHARPMSTYSYSDLQRVLEALIQITKPQPRMAHLQATDSSEVDAVEVNPGTYDIDIHNNYDTTIMHDTCLVSTYRTDVIGIWHAILYAFFYAILGQ